MFIKKFATGPRNRLIVPVVASAALGIASILHAAPGASAKTEEVAAPVVNCAAAAEDNLVKNGCFALFTPSGDPNVNNRWGKMWYNLKGEQINNWKTDSPVDILDSKYAQRSDGGNAIDIIATDQKGTISQIVPTIANHTYTFSVEHGINTWGGHWQSSFGSMATLDILDGASGAPLHHGEFGIDKSVVPNKLEGEQWPAQWRTHRVEFIAKSDQTVVKFSASNHDGSSGAILSNVRVSAGHDYHIQAAAPQGTDELAINLRNSKTRLGNAPGQLWHFRAVEGEDAEYQLVVPAGGSASKCLAANKEKTATAATCDPAKSSQLWTIELVEDEGEPVDIADAVGETVVIKNADDLCLDARNGATKNTDVIGHENCHRENNQQWSIVSD
jgi:hypothetical protein